MIGWLKRRRAPAPPPLAVVPAETLPDENVYRMSDLLTAADAPGGGGSEAFGEIAGRIVERHLRQGRRGIAVCGASAGTGVSLTTANLGIAMARLGVSVLVIDANLRQPALQDLIQPPRKAPGLQQLLRSEVERAEAVHEEVLSNLSLLYAGGPAADGDALLASDRFRTVLELLMREYECVLLDTPAANRSADALTVARAVGYALVVARRSHSYLGDTEFLSGQLAQAGVEVVGAVFNAARR